MCAQHMKRQIKKYNTRKDDIKYLPDWKTHRLDVWDCLHNGIDKAGVTIILQPQFPLVIVYFNLGKELHGLTTSLIKKLTHILSVLSRATREGCNNLLQRRYRKFKNFENRSEGQTVCCVAEITSNDQRLKSSPVTAATLTLERWQNCDFLKVWSVNVCIVLYSIVV